MKLKLFGDGDPGVYGDAKTSGKCMARTTRGHQCPRYARVHFPASQLGISVPGIDDVGVCRQHAAMGQGDEPGEIGGK